MQSNTHQCIQTQKGITDHFKNQDPKPNDHWSNKTNNIKINNKNITISNQTIATMIMNNQTKQLTSQSSSSVLIYVSFSLSPTDTVVFNDPTSHI